MKNCQHARRILYEPKFSVGDESDYQSRCIDCGMVLRDPPSPVIHAAARQPAPVDPARRPPHGETLTETRYQLSLHLLLNESLPENGDDRLPQRIVDAFKSEGIPIDPHTMRLSEVKAEALRAAPQGETLKGIDVFIDELSDLSPSPLTPHGRDCVRVTLLAFAAHVRRQEALRAAPPESPKAGGETEKLIEKLREPIDQGDYDGWDTDGLHISAANEIEAQKLRADTAMTLLMAWQKRAYEAEAEIDRLRAELAQAVLDREQADEALRIIQQPHWCQRAADAESRLAALQQERDELKQAADEARMGHVRLDECSDAAETKGKPLYDRISAKIQKLAEENAEKGHIIEAIGAEKDELRAKANAAKHRCAAAEYRAQRIVLDAELKQRAETAEAKLKDRDAALTALSSQWKEEYRVALEYDKKHGLRDITVELVGLVKAADDLDALLAGDQN